MVIDSSALSASVGWTECSKVQQLFDIFDVGLRYAQSNLQYYNTKVRLNLTGLRDLSGLNRH